MILANSNLYRIENINTWDASDQNHNTSVYEYNFEADIILNPDHMIFNGHFPENPILPGVCMLQMAIEVLEYKMSTILKLDSSKNLKFINAINPNETRSLKLTYKISQMKGQIKASCVGSSEQYDYFKLNMILIKS